PEGSPAGRSGKGAPGEGRPEEDGGACGPAHPPKSASPCESGAWKRSRRGKYFPPRRQESRGLKHAPTEKEPFAPVKRRSVLAAAGAALLAPLLSRLPRAASQAAPLRFAVIG